MSTEKGRTDEFIEVDGEPVKDVLAVLSNFVARHPNGTVHLYGDSIEMRLLLSPASESTNTNEVPK